MNGKWSGNSFLLNSNSLANHGDFGRLSLVYYICHLAIGRALLNILGKLAIGRPSVMYYVIGIRERFYHINWTL
jgi:hypothetical protein